MRGYDVGMNNEMNIARREAEKNYRSALLAWNQAETESDWLVADKALAEARATLARMEVLHPTPIELSKKTSELYARNRGFGW
jgi:hypothetical protein